MRLRLIAALGAGIIAGLVIQAAAFGGTAAKLQKPVTVHVVEHALTDTVIDTGKAGDTTGDLLTSAQDALLLNVVAGPNPGSETSERSSSVA